MSEFDALSVLLSPVNKRADSRFLIRTFFAGRLEPESGYNVVDDWLVDQGIFDSSPIAQIR
jgi:hypothetical protein